MPRVKICGLTASADLDVAVDAGADAVGLICAVPVETPREIPPARAATLADRTPPFVTSVLVTMPTDLEDLIELVDAVSPDAVQLHGEYEPETLEAFTDAIGQDLLLAVDAADLETAEQYDPIVDGFVVDSTDEQGAGGTGKTHDWAGTAKWADDLESPVVLAGGLTPENVAEAVGTAEPFAVDVASGVEVDGGQKDHDAIRSFVDRAQSAHREVNSA